MKLGEMNLEEAAKAATGNWKKFQCFCWHRERDLNDADNWAIVYTHHRDSGLIDQSNAAAIEEVLKPLTKGRNPDVVPERHDHWACGWIEGYSIRVFKRGRITKAFRVYHELAERMADYPLLDESDYSAREFEATIENISQAAWGLRQEYELPEGWESAVYGWFADNDCSAIENSDDCGGWPEESQLRRAFDGLGYQQTASV